MKQFTHIIAMLLFILPAKSQALQPAKLYPLKVYMAPNHAPISFGFFDSTGKRIPTKVGLPITNDSVLFYLPKGNLIMQVTIVGKPINLYIVKQPQPDTIRFHQ